MILADKIQLSGDFDMILREKFAYQNICKCMTSLIIEDNKINWNNFVYLLLYYLQRFYINLMEIRLISAKKKGKM